MNYLAVFIGGGLGSICRYGIAKLLAPWQFTFPYATLIANILSCIVLGIFVALVAKNAIHDTIRLLIMVGFCGGFSTFSTFTNETFRLFETGNLLYGFTNVFLSLILCVFSIYLGVILGNSIFLEK